MRWLPEFNTENCNKWLTGLDGLNIIKISEDVGHLIPPFSIRMKEERQNDLAKIYSPKEEKGGLMFASVSSIQADFCLNVEYVREITNDVETEFPGNSKTNSYFPKRTEYVKALSQNFLGNDPLFPIHFHTHPTRDKLEDIKYYHQLIHPLNRSRADVKAAQSRHIQLNNFTLLYLNAIVTGDNMEHRIMFYGKKVTSDSYTSEKVKQFISTIGEMTGEIKNEDVKLITRIALSGLGIFSMLSAPMLMPSLVDEFVYAFDKKEFWGKLERGKETIIQIPLREISD